jgi:hypothetical protein
MKISGRWHGSALKKNCIALTAPPIMTNFCIIDFVLLYIIINIYMGKTKTSKKYLKKLVSTTKKQF